MHNSPLLSRHYLDQLQLFVSPENECIEQKKHPSNDYIEADEVLPIWHQLELVKPISLEAGAQSHPLQYGLTGALAAQAENLQQALLQISEFSSLYNQVFQCHLSEQTDAFCYTLASPDLNDHYVAPLLEFELAALNHFLEFLSAYGAQSIQMGVMEIHLRHQARYSPESYRQYLHCSTIRFSQPENRLIFSKAYLQQNVFAANPKLYQVLHTEASRAMANSDLTLSLELKVKQLIKQYSQPKIPEISKISAICGLSISSFKRQLQQKNSSYQKIVNQVQKQKAQQLLRDPQQNFTDIAFQLGFANTSGFYRAFKRWAGLTPAEFRDNLGYR